MLFIVETLDRFRRPFIGHADAMHVLPEDYSATARTVRQHRASKQLRGGLATATRT